MMTSDHYAADLAVRKLAVILQHFEEEREIFEEKCNLMSSMARSLIEHGEHVFLDMQEYRERHPDIRATFRGRVSLAKLASAPWENEEAHWMAFEGSWFEEGEARDGEGDDETSSWPPFWPPSAPAPPPPLFARPPPPQGAFALACTNANETNASLSDKDQRKELARRSFSDLAIRTSAAL